ncbi:MAG: hypothetical protein H6721_10440 [Sandaracinus sp.]|nr:hypothetical protein [Sandaracinus sp.]
MSVAVAVTETETETPLRGTALRASDTPLRGTALRATAEAQPKPTPREAAPAWPAGRHCL